MNCVSIRLQNSLGEEKGLLYFFLVDESRSAVCDVFYIIYIKNLKDPMSLTGMSC